MTRFRRRRLLGGPAAPRNKNRIRAALAAAVVLAAIVTFAACGGCGKKAIEGGPGAPSAAANKDTGPDASPAEPPAGRAPPEMWRNAKEGDVEDLATLATHEGAAGLVEAAADAELRPTAIRAMGYARGWSQLPFLTRVATTGDGDEVDLALNAIVELAGRPRRAEDPEDVEELEAGCSALVALARDTTKARARRVPALRALRMMPCPKSELPTDLDAK